MKAEVKKIRLGFDELNAPEIVLTLGKVNTPKLRNDLAQLKQRLQVGKTLELELKEYREKRSLDANAYFHLLIHKIAERLNIGDDECKAQMVLEYGAVARDSKGEKVGVKLPEEVNVKEFYPYAKWFDRRKENGRTFNCYIFYKQTHTLDKAEMARLIDGVVHEAKQLGIETRTPDELAKMISLLEDER